MFGFWQLLICRYKLDSHLPVFMWNVDCEKRGVSPFWELLDLVTQADTDKLLDLETNSTEETPIDEPDAEKYPCVYCGVEYKQKGLKRHYVFCKDAPSSSK